MGRIFVRVAQRRAKRRRRGKERKGEKNLGSTYQPEVVTRETRRAKGPSGDVGGTYAFVISTTVYLPLSLCSLFLHTFTSIYETCRCTVNIEIYQNSFLGGYSNTWPDFKLRRKYQEILFRIL